MNFVIITHVNHKKQNNQYFGYDPYIREMNIWLKFVDKLIVVAPLENSSPTTIDSFYDHDSIDFRETSSFSFTNFKESFFALFNFPVIIWKIFFAMKIADHIHLRCPGNMGLLACFVQIFFPQKIKTAKYAGNWDPKSKQPCTNKLQKWILSNTFLTRNMQVLVYGDWESQSKNIKPFFTATYSEFEKENFQKTGFEETIEFVFVGSLVAGKNPMYAVKLIHNLIKKNDKITLDIYGEGAERESLEKYIRNNHLENHIFLHGNQDKETLKIAYQKSHFVILPSKSEGWPKAIAEGMFWGCVPIATQVSCVPFMLDYGNRGILLNMNLESDSAKVAVYLNDKIDFDRKSKLAAEWSQNYTTDVFETEIKKLLTR